MNAQRRVYLRGLLEKTAQWRKEQDILDRITAIREQLDKAQPAKARRAKGREPQPQRPQAATDAIPAIEPLGKDHNRSVAKARRADARADAKVRADAKARATKYMDERYAAQSRVKAYFDGSAKPNKDYGMGRIMDHLAKAEPASGDVPPGPYKVRAEQQAANAKALADHPTENARVKAYFDSQAKPNKDYGMGRIMDHLAKAEPASGDVPPGPYKALAEQQAAKAKAPAAKTEIDGSNDVAPQVPGRLAAVQKFLADNKTGIGIGAGVVGGGYLALKLKKMLDERRRSRREEENTASMHPKYAAVRQPRGDLRTVKQSSSVKTAAPAPGPVPGPVPKPELSSLGMGGYGALGGYGAFNAARALKPKPDVAPPAPGTNPRFNLTENQKVRGVVGLSTRGAGALLGMGVHGAYKALKQNPRFNLTENQKVRGGTALSRLGRVGTALSGLGRGGAALPGLGMDAYRLLRSRPLPRTEAAK